MKAKLSQIVTNNPEIFFQGAPDCLFYVIETFLSYFSTPGYATRGIEVSNKTIAQGFCTAVTVSRQASLLVDLGLIRRVDRGYNSSLTFLTDWWRRPDVQAILPQFFKRFPRLKPIHIANIALSLSMLFSGGKDFRENKLIHYTKRRTAIRNSDLSISGYQRRGRESITMKQKIDKIVGIRSALLKRGETELIDPYKMLSFSDECLDECIAGMRFSKPKYPYRYFLAKAFEYCKRNNIEPDWVTADAMRNTRITEFEADPGRPAVVKAAYVKREETAEERKSNEQIVRETKDRQKRGEIAMVEREEARRKERGEKYRDTKPDLSNHFMKTLVAAQIERMQEVGYESEEGVRIRSFLKEVGIVV